MPAAPATWEVPAKQLSACQTASEAMQQVRTYMRGFGRMGMCEASNGSRL